jgi:hypothetical protein
MLNKMKSTSAVGRPVPSFFADKVKEAGCDSWAQYAGKLKSLLF